MGTYYLKEITASFERIYERKTPDSGADNSTSLNNSRLIDEGQEEDDYFNADAVDIDSISLGESKNPNGNSNHNLSKGGFSSKSSFGSFKGGLTRNTTYVWASGRPNVNVVVTGVAAALPGRNTQAFKPGVDNIQRIITGENFISELPTEVKDSMIEKNVCEMVKGKDGTIQKVPIGIFYTFKNHYFFLSFFYII